MNLNLNLPPNTIPLLIGAIIGIGGIAGRILYITRNHISKNEAYKNLTSKELCNERSGNIEEKIDNLRTTMVMEFGTIREMIRNAKQ